MIDRIVGKRRRNRRKNPLKIHGEIVTRWGVTVNQLRLGTKDLMPPGRYAKEEDSVDTRQPDDEADEETYVITPSADTEIPAKWQTVATYDLELPAKCPHCRDPIRTLKVVRLSRSKVAFTSTLPRGGRAMVCPQCECIVSVEVSGML